MLALMSSLLLFLASVQAALCGEPLKVPTEKYGDTEHIRHLKRTHPGLYPFISHMTFRNASDIAIDAFMETFDPDTVKRGDVVYLNIWYLEWFVEQVHDRIKHPYILVTCDVESHIPTLELKKLLYDPKCAAWFGRNMIFSRHPKLIQIPMGQDLTLFSLEAGVEPLMQASGMKGALAKQHLLYMNHFPRQWGDRDKIVCLFEHAPYCFSRNHSDREYAGVSLETYYQDLLSSRFVLSPLGYETDCVRTWEALTLGCIPIVEHSFLDPLFEGMPVVLIHNWESIDEHFLWKKYDELKHLPCSDRIYFDYWLKKIKEVQTRLRNNDMSFSSVEASLFKGADLVELSAILQEHGKTCLFYRGFLTAARSLQLADEMPFLSAIYLRDPWMDEKMWNHLDYYLMDHHLLFWKNKVKQISEDQFFSVLNSDNHKGPAVFVDLSFYRHSLFWNEFNKYARPRHSLKRDMQKVLTQLKWKGLLCGNMFSDAYVKDVVLQLKRENSFAFESRGDFWLLMSKDKHE